VRRRGYTQHPTPSMSLAGDDTMSDRHVGPGLRHHAWGPEVHIIILSASSLSHHCPRCWKRVRSLHAVRDSDPISRRPPQAPRAIQYHSHLHLPGLTHMRGGTGLLPRSLPKPAHTDARTPSPQLHCRSLDMHPKPRRNLRSQHNVGASEHFDWPNGRHHEGEHKA